MLEPSVGKSVLVTWLVQRGIINYKEAIIGREQLQIALKVWHLWKDRGKKGLSTKHDGLYSTVITNFSSAMESPWAKVTCQWSPLSYRKGFVLVFRLCSLSENSLGEAWPCSSMFLGCIKTMTSTFPCDAHIHFMQICGAVCQCMVPVVLYSQWET